MKKIALILPLLSLLVIANSQDDPIAGVFNQVANISIPRAPTYDIYNPFIEPKAPIIEESIKRPIQNAPDLPKLSAIINDRVFLNKKWVKRGDKVEGYTVLVIGIDGVILKRENKLYKVTLLTSANKIKITISDR